MIGIDYSLLIVILNFVVLLIVLNKILYKPITKFLRERQAKIADDMDQAVKSRDEAGQLVEQRKQDLKASTEEMRLLMSKTKHEAEDQAGDIIRQAHGQQKKILAETDALLITEKKKAMQELESRVARLIADVAGKIIADKMDEETDAALIEQLLKERGVS
ncbi:MAG: F0F1 ATP synthase subunit B [Candidatus Cloacimonetes bacterium]|nr:F0F1 ATP synthase subunit B [Candidatus Cloacimonadota bacterium]